MKKLFAILLVTIMPGTLVPAQETALQKVKDFLSSKKMMLVYGAALGGGAVKLFLHTSQNRLKSVSDRVIKKSNDVDATPNIIEQFETVIGYLEYITNHKCTTVIRDADKYHFRIEMVDDFATCQAASNLLAKAKVFLAYYNRFREYQRLPTIEINHEELFGHRDKFEDGVINSSDLLLQKMTISIRKVHRNINVVDFSC